MNRARAVRELGRLGFELDESVTGYNRVNGWTATIDPIGRVSISGDCRGIVVFDYTATASEFWQEVVKEAREHVAYLEPCPHPAGECEFHDGEDEA